MICQRGRKELGHSFSRTVMYDNNAQIFQVCVGLKLPGLHPMIRDRAARKN